MIERFFAYVSLYPTVRYAAIAVLLISVCAALLGVSLVLKRYSMIGDGLSHVSFGSTAIATVLGLTTPIYVTMPLTVASAILLLKLNNSSRIKGDSAVAMISSAALAFGYILLNLFGDNNANASSDACATLFGSGIIGIGISDVLLCSTVSVVVLTVFILFYNKIFAVTFDESFAASAGINVAAYNTLIAVITAVTVVLAMNLLGALLASALIIFPALSAMRLFKSFKSVTASAVVIAAISALSGTVLSIIFATAIGPTVVAADLAVFTACFIIGAIKK